MSSYSLAKALHYKLTDKTELYSHHLVSRFMNCVREAIAQNYEFKKRPNKKTREEYQAKLNTSIAVLEVSVYSLITRVRRAGWKRDPKSFITLFIPRKKAYNKLIPYTSEEKHVNNILFNLLMQGIIYKIVRSEHFLQVCKDYDLVKEIKDKPNRFKDLERRCSKTLKWFVYNYHVRGIDKEDQYQEGLLVIWDCAKTYKGQNFATFPGMVRKSLHNKFVSLLRYNSADIRRIDKDAIRFIPSENSSSTMKTIDELTYSAWALSQREQDFLDTNTYDPFMTRTISDMINFLPDQRVKLEAIIGNEPCDWRNFPHTGNRKVILMEHLRGDNDGKWYENRFIDPHYYEDSFEI